MLTSTPQAYQSSPEGFRNCTLHSELCTLKSERYNSRAVPFFDISELFVKTFIVEHTVAVALEFGIGDLLAEFLAHALVVLRFLQTARTVAARTLESLFDGPDDF